MLFKFKKTTVMFSSFQKEHQEAPQKTEELYLRSST